MNNKGFTLIELLATISLLAILMLIAVPNVIGVVNRNKTKTYVEDAKKLVALAEYKIRSDSQYKPSTAGNAYCFSMNFLGTGDFDTTAPNGGSYLPDKSYVRVWKEPGSGEIKYYVVLIEQKENNEYVGIGISENYGTLSSKLYKDDTSSLIKTTNNVSDIKSCSGIKSF